MNKVTKHRFFRNAGVINVYSTDKFDHVLPDHLQPDAVIVEPGPRYLKRMRVAQIRRRAEIKAYALGQDAAYEAAIIGALFP